MTEATEHTPLRIENHGKHDYFYCGDEYIGEVNKVSFNLGANTGALIVRSVNNAGKLAEALERVCNVLTSTDNNCDSCHQNELICDNRCFVGQAREALAAWRSK